MASHFDSNALGPLRRATPSTNKISFLSGDIAECSAQGEAPHSQPSFTVQLSHLKSGLVGEDHFDTASFELGFAKPQGDAEASNLDRLAGLFSILAYKNYTKNIFQLSRLLGRKKNLNFFLQR